MVRLSEITNSSSTLWHRIGKTKHPPRYYSTDPGWRFSRRDMPGTLYLGETTDACFWEVFWDDLATRAPADRRLDYAKIEERSAWRAAVPSDLLLVNTLNPEGMIEIGAHGGTFRGPYSICQDWAKALRIHPAKPHGILYESVRKIGTRCLALFQEYETTHAPTFHSGVPLTHHPDLVVLLTKYGDVPPSL